MNVDRLNGSHGKVRIVFDDDDEAARFAFALGNVGNRATTPLEHSKAAAFRATTNMLFRILRGQAESIGQRVF